MATFVGEALGADGDAVPPGTRVEAYVGDARCGVTSTRRTGSFSGYTLAISGPDARPGCERGATLSFRIDGQTAGQTATNDPGSTARPSTPPCASARTRPRSVVTDDEAGLGRREPRGGGDLVGRCRPADGQALTSRASRSTSVSPGKRDIGVSTVPA